LNVRFAIVVITLTAVIGSALGLVYTRHDSRRLEAHLGEQENQRDDIIAEWSRLQLEQAMLADAGQVESKARDQLGMRSPENAQILVVKP